MSASLDQVIGWIILYRYVLIFPLAFFEGPMITIIAGFLLSLGYFNFWLLYCIIILSDIAGDITLYAVGRYWGKAFIRKFGHYVGITKQ